MVRASWWQAVRQFLNAAPRRDRRPRPHRPWAETLEDRLAPTVTLSISNPAPFPKPDTGQLTAMFVVTRSGDLMPSVQVQYQTQDGTGPNAAHAGVDYMATSGTLGLGPNQTTATITVPIVGNNVFQADKTFTVSLSNARSSTVAFAQPQTFAVNKETEQVVVADFNGDGKPDLAVRSSFLTTDTISILLNTTPVGATTPSFAPPQILESTQDQYEDLVVADFNGDHKPDLAVTIFALNRLSVFVNTTATGATSPSFALRQDFDAGLFPSTLAVGDFNGDGMPDLAIRSNTPITAKRDVVVFLNTTPAGATTLAFAPPQTFAIYDNSGGSIAVGDFNGDGQSDLVLANYDTKTVEVLLNMTPANATTATFVPFGGSQQLRKAPTSLVVGDFNGDGKSDIAITAKDGTVEVLLAISSPYFIFGSEETFPVGQGPDTLAAGDFNGDGKPDLAVVDESDGTISLLLNDTSAGATFADFTPQQSISKMQGFGALAVGDFNGDRALDLAVLKGDGVSVLLNTSVTVTNRSATGTISSSPEAPASITAVPGTTPQSTAGKTAFAIPLAVDVRDAAGALVQGVTVTFTAPATGASGTFGSSASVMVTTNASGRATASALTANSTGGNFTVTAQAAGGSNPSTTFSLTNTVHLRYFAVAGAPGIVQLRRDGDNSLITEFAPYGSGYTGPITVAVGDVNGDGIPDLVTGAAVGNPDVRVFDGKALMDSSFNPANPGSAQLAQWFAYALQFNVGANVAVGDIEKDGYADIVTGANVGNPHVKVYRSKDIANHTFDPNGSSVLAQWFAYGLQFNVGANVAVGDVTGDGYADVVTGANVGNPHVKVYNGKDIATHTFDPNGASLLVGWFAYGLQFNVGANVAVADVNGDGFAEVITGASRGNPQVKVYDGKAIATGSFQFANPDASALTQFYAYDRLNADVGVRVAATDFEGMGKADILTAPTQGPAEVRVVKGTATGTLPPVVNGIDLVPSDLSGVVTVGAG